MTQKNDNTDHYLATYIEALNEQFKAIREGMDAMAGVPAQLEKLTQMAEENKREHALFRGALKLDALSIQNHETRITKLEFKTA